MNIPTKKTSNKTIFNVLVDGFFILLIILCFYLQIPMNSSQVVYIPKGGTSEIITYLKKNNFDLLNIDKQIIRFFGYPQSGWLNIGRTSCYSSFLLEYSLFFIPFCIMELKLSNLD